MLSLTVDQKGETEKGIFLKGGEVVEYLAHLPGGNVKIRHADGTEDVAHPLCFAELK